LAQYFRIDDSGLSITPLYAVPKSFACTRWQYHWLKTQFLDDVLLFQVGCYYEFYDPAEDDLALSLGLKPMAKNRRGARFGMPLSWGVRFAERIVRQLGQVLWVAEQSGVMEGGLKTRLPVERWVADRHLNQVA
jgi:RNA-directed DNA polymerase